MNYMVILLLFTPSLFAIFDYDRAVASGKKGLYEKASTTLAQVLADDPDKPDVLYDAGIAAYKNGDFGPATSYFSKVVDTPQVSSSLQEQAAFNAGNSAVKQNKLEQALEWYDKALTFNPDNERTQHNRDIVKKMLKKKKEEEKNKKQKKDQQQDKQEPNEDQNDMNNDKNDEQDQKRDKKDQQENKQNKKEQESGKQDQEQKDQEQSEKNNEPGKDSEKKSGSKEKENQSQQERKEEKGSGAQEKNEEKKEDGTPENMQETKALQKLDPALKQFLARHDKQDAHNSKQLMKVLVSGNNGGKRNEEHNW